jgi:arylsulfatase A-like enzyme
MIAAVRGGEETGERRPEGHRLAATLALAAGLASCRVGPVSGRPSILLFVFDTTRVDAVSAYGRVAGTTPMADSLAATGLRYTHAYAQAPWTLPSHATLFTGLLPSQHGAGWHQPRAPDTWVTLAERLRDAGYETVGTSENAWIHEAFNTTQGFERFAGIDIEAGRLPDVRAVVAAWARERNTNRPFFLFVNVLDAHVPYLVRATNPFLPPGVDAKMAEAVPQEPQRPNYYFCSRTPHERELEILRGLYLGGVAEADAKLRDVVETLRAAGLARDLVTIVTADHGEHFGEHRLVGHAFSLREELLHVPLIIHGIPGGAPAVITDPVQLADIMPTVLRWAGLPVPDGLAGRPLPVAPDATRAVRPVLAEQFDLDGELAPDAHPQAVRGWQISDRQRRFCTPADRVFGDMRALIRYPFKLISYANYPPQLYDLSADAQEEQDLASVQPALAAELMADLDRPVRALSASAAVAAPAADVLPSPGIVDRLRALGYVAGDPVHAPATR